MTKYAPKTQNIIAFIDTEVSPTADRILDYGAILSDGRSLHTRSFSKFAAFLQDSCYLCGHNLLAHDIPYLKKEHQRSVLAPPHTDTDAAQPFSDLQNARIIDTLYLSPLLFPRRPYHALVKDDKLQTEELNNPVNDARKASELFYDACHAFAQLPQELAEIYRSLLWDTDEFAGFFTYLGGTGKEDAACRIRRFFAGMICEHVDLEQIVCHDPAALAYCLALIYAQDKYSLIPGWVHRNFPQVETLMARLRGIPCKEGCAYCERELGAVRWLKALFGYDSFRDYDGVPLQERAVQAAIRQESLLAVFPTGGGKSLTFQLPALMAGEAAGELTVVISPLQSLMMDQVENLKKRGIADAVTVNGLLSPLERAETFERLENGLATLLYISPEMLRSKTVEQILLKRSIARFVIDEAHCFSAWGQDFRVDYLYIGDFIKELQEKKGISHQIPVSCFTATAKQDVIRDIKHYFKEKLGLELALFTTESQRKNLHYRVLPGESDEEKYEQLRSLIEEKDCPTIVYVSRTRRTWQLADRLCSDGLKARPFHGKMESREKVANQKAFMEDQVQIMVATSAFGMGVDKSNVGLVVHYDISDSLENYVQEAGRAGRDDNLEADCYVLFDENDLDKHFILLNQTKMNIREIQQVWRAVKELSGNRSVIRRSPLELARKAGWDETVMDLETRVKTAVQALENAGYVKRGKNVPHVYATSILVPNMIEAAKKIDQSRRMDDHNKEYAKRILQMLISRRSIAKAGNDEAESRIDYISDLLGIPKADVIDTVQLLRQEGILADTRDLTAYIRRDAKERAKNHAQNELNKYIAIEGFLLKNVKEEGGSVNLKELNELALADGIRRSSVQAIRTVFYYWIIQNQIKKTLDGSSDRITFLPEVPLGQLWKNMQRRKEVASFLTGYLYQKEPEETERQKAADGEEVLVQFSVLELKEEFEKSRDSRRSVSEKEMEDALLYLSKIDAIRLEGGFLVLYNSMEIRRLIMNNKIRYKVDDYKQLGQFYKQKIQQIHIVGEYAGLMVKDSGQAQHFVSDYFKMDYQKFLKKYFEGERLAQIGRNLTPAKYQMLFENLSEAQKRIIQDNESQYLLVAAGPGSGKTKVLVHKLAALLQLEDVRSEQLLMVTFSRAAATEFKQRLHGLIGNAASYVEIKTFHSYCFDLLGKIGKTEGMDHVVADAARQIRNGEVEAGKITKTVVVIDEAQDMDADAAALIWALMEKNEDMRVIAVGDDDQNIYRFRGSDSKYFQEFARRPGSARYDLLENYRSSRRIVAFANAFAARITKRMKRQPVRAVHTDDGVVRLIRCRSRSLEQPVVSCLIKLAKETNSNDQDRTNGTICVLTNTNEEALKVFALLSLHKKKAKLMQTNEGFSLGSLAEIQYFLQVIRKKERQPVISDAIWEEAVKELRSRYAKSECLPLCCNLLDTFAKVSRKKYVTDLEEFLRESKLEDFYEKEQETIVVSTIHKSKGKEFDKVVLLLNQMQLNDDEDRRRLYVGITRAKRELYLFCNTDCLDGIASDGMERQTDLTEYPQTEEILSQLSHRDIVLGRFRGKQRQMLQMYSGMELDVDADGVGLSLRGERVVSFSRKYLGEIRRLNGQGYRAVRAKVRFVVTWKGKEDKEVSVILLPEIVFARM